MEKQKLLPPEIIAEIISWLPVKSVLNCRIVCKTWKTLTYNPSFALMHFRRSCSSLMTHQHHLLDDVDNDNDNDDEYQNHPYSASSTSTVGFVPLIVFGFYGGPSQLYYGEYDDDVKVKEEEVESTYKKITSISHTSLVFKYHGPGRPRIFYREYDDSDGKVKWKEVEPTYKKITKINHPPLEQGSRVVGSCNGFLCFTVYHHLIYDPVYICNPITREYIKLPRFTRKGLKGGVNIASGFGYHPKTNEYKVVRIYYDMYHCEPFMGHVQVYTLGSGSGWRNKGETEFSLGGEAVLANGALHWGVNFGKIVSFDLADEEFFLLPSPPCSNRPFSRLKVLGGLLCVATQEEASECVKVWSLKKTKKSSYNMLKKKEHCHSWSWSLEFNIKLWEGISSTVNFLDAYKLLALAKGGEVLLLWSSNDGILSRYNLKTSSLEKFMIYDTCYVRFGLDIIPHMNSFISLKHIGEDVKVIGSDEEVIAPTGDLFHDYFRKADLNQDGLIDAVEEAIFFQGFDLPPLILGQIFGELHANRNYNLTEEEFFDVLKLVSVVQSGKELTPDVVNETLHGPDSANISAPKIINPSAAAVAVKTWTRRCYNWICGNCRRCRPDKFNLDSNR